MGKDGRVRGMIAGRGEIRWVAGGRAGLTSKGPAAGLLGIGTGHCGPEPGC